jgi:transcriptional regulator with XRE-family HTH domain
VIWYSSVVRPPQPADPDLAALIGGSVKSVRVDIGWSQRELAARLRTSLGAVQRLEAGQRHVDSRVATAAMRVLGIRPSVDPHALGIPGRREQRDEVHGRCSNYGVRQLLQREWEARTEVEIGDGRFRGWIDILAFRRKDRALLVIEVKTEIDDVGRVLRSLGWYVRSSRVAAQSHGWSPRLIVPVLLCLATTETDARLAAIKDQLRIELPGRARELSDWIVDPTAKVAPPSLALVDPRSRRQGWLIRTWSDGRRSPAPYRDYRDAAAALRASARRRGAPRARPRAGA